MSQELRQPTETKCQKLARAVKEWWEHHKYDTTGERGEYNVYDEEPEFVAFAKAIIGDWERQEEEQVDEHR